MRYLWIDLFLLNSLLASLICSHLHQIRAKRVQEGKYALFYMERKRSKRSSSKAPKTNRDVIILEIKINYSSAKLPYGTLVDFNYKLQLSQTKVKLSLNFLCLHFYYSTKVMHRQLGDFYYDNHSTSQKHDHWFITNVLEQALFL